MTTISFKAHYDGQRIVLDEPCELPTNTPLIVTVEPAAMSGEREDWAQIATAGLALAYSSDEPEYSLADIKK
jgi:hypothetical protein